MQKKFKMMGIIGLVVLILLAGFVNKLSKSSSLSTHSDRLVLLKPAKTIITTPLWLTNNETLSDASLKGNWSFFYFGFTQCPDVCPTVLSALSRAYFRLAKDGLADHMTVYFVTVDPMHDDKIVMTQYLKSFNPKFIGVSGTEQRLNFFKKQFGIFSQEADDHSISHSEAIVILNPEGRFVAMLTAPHFVDDLVKDITYILQLPSAND